MKRSQIASASDLLSEVRVALIDDSLDQAPGAADHLPARGLALAVEGALGAAAARVRVGVLGIDAPAFGDTNNLATGVVITVETERDVVSDLRGNDDSVAVRGAFTIVKGEVRFAGQLREVCGDLLGFLEALHVAAAGILDRVVLDVQGLQLRRAGVRGFIRDADDLTFEKENVAHEDVLLGWYVAIISSTCAS